ncbi:MAG: SH3 domain-containing protein, partial [Gammaproteobacteria bacterium]|nr:SH3 domain-containing protein [Gammaproteobacteria bacterium]
DCHSDYVPRERRGLQFRLADGVACEACHGGAEQWLGIHISGGGDKHAESLAAGLYPTEDPEARAELCLSCHLGTRDKFATHEIMGAGHPRLSFDLQKFTDIQPRHYRVDQDYRTRKTYVEDTRAWAIGQVSAALQYMSLLQGPRMSDRGMFPELGLFDCHACHHAFKDLRWEANERTSTPPGSVLLNDSSLAMSQIIAGVVQPGIASSLTSGIRQLQQAAQTDIASIRSAAAGLERQLTQLAETLRGQEFGQQRNNRMIEALASAVADLRFSDYSDAEQATMALDVYSGVTGSYSDEVDALYEAVADQEVTDPKRFDPKVFSAVFKRASTTRAAPVTREPVRTVQQPARVDERPASVRQILASNTAPRVAAVQPAPDIQMGAPSHTVTSTALRVRSGPDSGARIRGAVYRGDGVEVLKGDGEWSEINYSDEGVIRRGWVATRYLAPIGSAAPVRAAPESIPQAAAPPATPSDSQMGAPTHRVSSTALRVRFTPETGGRVRGAIYRGDAVEVLSRDGDWSQVSYSDEGVIRRGWVASRFLAPIGSAGPASPPQPAPAAVVEQATPATSSGFPMDNPSHRVSGNAVRVRFTPDSAAPVRTVLYSGDSVEVLNSVGEWSRINYSDDDGVIQRGWVSSSFLTPIQ